MFTDLANFTDRVAQGDREDLRRLLQEHEAFVRPILTKRGGRIIKQLGDAYLALFDAATDAAQAGKDIIERLGQNNSLVIRVSCATGDIEEVVSEEGVPDAFGETVNLASRINGVTPAGEFYFSESTRVCMNQREVPWEPVSQFHLKGIPGESKVNRVVPRNKCWLPPQIKDAVKNNALVRIRRGEAITGVGADPVLLFEGYTPGSQELRRAVDMVPVIDPARLWLATYNISPADRYEWEKSGHGLIITSPAALSTALDEIREQSSNPSNTTTIFLETNPSEVDLVICGLALPAVPMADVVSGYSYDLLHDGRWVNRSEQAVLRVDVSPAGPRVLVQAAGVGLDDRAVQVGQQLPLTHGVTLQTPGGTHRFVRLPDGSPYVGMLVAETPVGVGVAVGQTVELGREVHNMGMNLPDRRGQDNIRWCPGPRAARAREGGFTLDRALAGRRHAAVDAERGGSYRVRALHERCPTYLYSESRPLERVADVAVLKSGEIIIAGTTVVVLRASTQNSQP